MAVAFVTRPDAQFFTGSTKATASTAWTSGHLFAIHAFEYFAAGNIAVPVSVAGATMTFVRATVCDNRSDFGGNTQAGRISVWVAIGNGNTEAATLTLGQSDTDGVFSIYEWSGTATTNGGLDAIRQAVAVTGATTTTPSATLAALAASDSVAVGMLVEDPQLAITAGSGFTSMLGTGHSTPISFNYNDERQANVTTVNWTVAPTPSSGMGIAYEVAASGVGLGLPPFVPQQAVPFMNNQRI